MVSEVRWRFVFPPLTIRVALAALPSVDDDSANVSPNSSRVRCASAPVYMVLPMVPMVLPLLLSTTNPDVGPN